MHPRIAAFSFSIATLLLSACAAAVASEDALSESSQELSAFGPEQCLFGATKQDLLASPALSVGPTLRYTAESKLSPLVAAQLAEGVDGLASAPALLAFVQDGELFQQEVRELASSRTFTLTTYWAGDNPHGFVQLAGATQRVAKISDDSVEHCLVSAQRAPSASERCAFGDDLADLTLSDRFTVSSTTNLTVRTKLPALGELQVRALGEGVRGSARDVFAQVDAGRITRWYATDRATGLRYALYSAGRGGAQFGVVFGYGTLDVLASIVPGQQGFVGCLAPTARNCQDGEALIEASAYDVAIEEAMQNAYSECRYCSGLEVRSFDVLCPGDVPGAVVSILNDASQGRPDYEPAHEIGAQEALASLGSSGIQSLDAVFRTALGSASDIHWYFSSGRYEPTAPGADGAEKLLIATSDARALSVTVRDEYP